LCEQVKKNTPIAAVTIAAQQGSTPRTTGAKMLVTPEGLLAGTIGGGILEARAIDEARHIAEQGGSRLVHVDLAGALDGTDMICGGAVRVFSERIDGSDETAALFNSLLQRLKQGENAFLLTALSGGERRVLPEDPSGGATRGTCIIQLDGREWLLESYMAQSLLLIAGGGHVGLSTSQIAASCGFDVTIIDDRPEFAFPGRFPWARSVLLKPRFLGCFADLPVREDSAIVIVTRGHVHDGAVLEQALATKAGYIGMIGSLRKRDAIYATLAAKGISDGQIGRVHSPIGLSIGAETPAEIAVSIMAEIIALRTAEKQSPAKQPA
jgi:xanthine dehydrogenase accessory factor